MAILPSVAINFSFVLSVSHSPIFVGTLFSMQSMNQTLQWKFIINNTFPLHTEALAKIYNIEDPDDLPITVDLLEIFNMKKDAREAALISELKSAPGDCGALIAKVMVDMESLDK